jgi:hypothetical protein
MDVNTLYYTYSTICQMLAGAFGFLIAAFTYQMKNIESDMEGKAKKAGEHRQWGNDLVANRQLIA